VFYYAEPVDDTPPKSKEDEHSICAKWVTRKELDNYRMRGIEPEIWFKYLDEGGLVYPMSLWTKEGVIAPVKDKIKQDRDNMKKQME